MSAVGRFTETARHAGLAYAARKAFDTVVPEQWLRIQGAVVLCHVLDGTPPRDGEGAPARWLTAADGDALADLGYGHAVVRDRLRDGAHAAGLSVDGRLAAVSWFARGTHWEYPWLEVVLESASCWNWDIWVRGDLRGRGLGARLHRWSAAQLARRGIVKVFNSVDSLNRPSLRMCTGAGFATAGRFRYLRLGHLVALRAGGLALRVDLSRGDRLQLHPDRLQRGDASAWCVERGAVD